VCVGFAIWIIHTEDDEAMSKRAWTSIVAAVLVCIIVAVAFFNNSKCRGADACAAAAADGQERTKPNEVQ
jgi:hypothetical protein